MVVVMTVTMMAVEIAAGILFGSMALLADGLHMASHTVALGIGVYAYVYARRHAKDRRFSFGTGKVNSLGGFTGAVLLSVFALIMAWESLERMLSPVPIIFNQAIGVAAAGLIVNALSFYILQGRDHDHADHDHPHDHNLRAAYFHVLADALTSLLAISALLTAKHFGALWMDPLMGIVGAVLVSRWSWGLLKTTSRTLLDHQAGEALQTKIINAVEAEKGTRVTDLHLWSIGPGIYSVILSVSAENPKPPQSYKEMIPKGCGLVHITVEVS